ncbi:MAG: xanthine dehydrogenase family protein subunit M [Alphaproteobacteria bacterium]|nr:xanthine dehydrogenase family protein subunit M [Alphaproteobacteria bacterium]
MKPGPFVYHDPASVDDVVALLGQHEDAKLLAGGQSLMPMLNMRFVVPDHVIDLNGVADMSGVNDAGAALTIGAMTRQRELAGSETVAARTPIIQEALAYVGHFQTRTRGTIGGSLCHLDPAAELPTVAAAYDAQLTAAGPDGTRDIAFAEWPQAYMMTALAPEEVLTQLKIPYWSEPHGSAFVEFARRHGDFAIIGIAALMAVDGGKISRAAVAVGGADVRPLRLADVEAMLVGEAPGETAFAEAGAMARKIDAMSDAYVTTKYRQRLAGVLVERALAQAAERANAKSSNGGG